MPIQSPFEHSWAVVIGINAYQAPIPSLRSARPDAERVATLLREKHGYTVDLLVDDQATLAALTTLLTEELPTRVGPKDQLLFYFAGHGVTQKEDAGPQGMLLPVDAMRSDAGTFLEMKVLYEALEALKCPHLFVVLDACFSGTFRWYSTRADFDRDPASDEGLHCETYEYFLRSPARQVLTSTAQDEQALDVLDVPGVFGARGGTGDHSPFAQAFCASLEGLADTSPAPSGDGLITARELYSAISDGMAHALTAANSDYRQTPSLWAMRTHGKGEYLFFNPKKDALTLRPAPPLDRTTNPWVGLASYEAAQQELFFGCAAQIATLAEMVQHQAMVVVRGASGTGKSSLVKAGLLPALPASDWFVLPVMRPGVAPLQSLAQALNLDTSATVSSVRALAAHVDAFLAERMQGKVLLVIDQFEEMTTQARSLDERDAMLALLVELAQRHPAQLRLVFTIRSDFSPLYDRLPIGQAWKPGIYDIPRMTRAQFRDVIEKPAEKRVMIFEPPTLVDTLVDAVVDMPGALPLLSFVLSELYVQYLRRRANDRAITGQDYDDLGGVAGALQQRADALFAELPDDAHRETFRRVMLRMITQEGGSLARRRVLRDQELDYPHADEQRRVATVLQRLSEARLLVSGSDADGQSFVEPAHDALVTGWGRLTEWIVEERLKPFSLGMQQRLARAAEEWSRGTEKGKDGQLWSDTSRSALLAPLVQQQAPFLNRREREFARLSVRGRRIRRMTISAVTAGVLLAGVATLVFGLQAKARAELVRLGAVVRTVATVSNDDPTLAGQLLGTLDSTHVEKLDSKTRLLLLELATTLATKPRVIAQRDLSVYDPAINFQRGSVLDARRGQILLVQADSLKVARLTGDMRVVSLSGCPFSPMHGAFNATGDMVAAAFAGHICAWRLDRPAQPIVMTPNDIGDRPRVQFSPDGTAILKSDLQSETATIVRIEPGSDVWVSGAAAYSPLSRALDGVRPAFGTEGSDVIMLTGPQTLSLVRLPLIERGVAQPSVLRSATLPARVRSFSVGPDSNRVAVQTTDGRVLLVSLGVGGPPRLLLPATADTLTQLAWSPDGSRLAAATDSQVTIVETRSGRVIRRLSARMGGLPLIDFSDDGSMLLTNAPNDRGALVTAVPGGQPIFLAGGRATLAKAAFTRDDGTVVTMSYAKALRLWALPAKPRLYFRDAADTVQSLMFDPESRRLAAGTARGDTWLLSLAGTDQPQRAAGAHRDVRVLSFTPDGRSLVTVAAEGARSLFRTDSFRVLHSDAQPPRGAVLSSRLSPSGRIGVRFFRYDNPVLFRTASAAPETPLFAGGQKNNCATFDAAEEFIALCALGARPGVTITWTDGRGDRRFIPLKDTWADVAAFAHRGRQLAVGTGDGSVVVYADALTDSGQVVFSGKDPIETLEFSAGDDKLLVRTQRGGVHVLSGKGLGTPIELKAPCDCLRIDARFAGAGDYVVTRSPWEPGVRLVRADTSGESAHLQFGGDTLDMMAISPDGRWLATVSKRGDMQVSPLDLHSALLPFRRPALCLSVDERTRYLGESSPDATKRFGECEASRRTFPSQWAPPPRRGVTD